MSSNEILLGQDCKTSFCGFGDDSVKNNILVYALAILHRSKISLAEQLVNNLKEEYKIPPEINLHCRILFHDDARRKKGLSHLTTASVKKLIEKLIYELNLMDVLCRVVTAIKPISATLNVLSKSHETFPELNTNSKNLLGLLSMVCYNIPENNPLKVKKEDMEIWVDGDSTKIEWAGKRKQAHSGYQNYSDVGAQKGSLFHFVPHIMTGEKHPLLQVADVVAFISANAVEEFQRKQRGWYSKLLSKIKLSYQQVNF